MKTLATLYNNSVRRFADRTASAMHEREAVTFAEFDSRVRALQKTLLDGGLTAGDHVALLSSSMPNWSVCYFAVVEMGMVVVPILPGFSGEEFDQIIAHAECRGLCVSDKLYAKLSPETIARMQIVVRTKNLATLHTRAAGTEGERKTPREEDTAAIIYTSGTTAAPKGVMLSHGALARQVAIAGEVFPITEHDVFLSILPLSHAYECSIGMLYPFARGASVCYLDRPPTVTTLIPAMRDIRPTVMLSVPLIVEKLYKNQVLAKFTRNRFWRLVYRDEWLRKLLHRVAGKRLMAIFGGRVRFFGIGGAKLDLPTERFLREGRFPYAIGYGLTETAPLLAAAAPTQTRLGTTGPAVPGVSLRIEQGELQALTPCAMSGYFRNPQKTAEAFTPDGWFRTGDLAEISADGYVSIKGRIGSMLVSAGGENIYPEEIESILNSLTWVDDSLVTEDQKGKLVALVRFNYDELERRYYGFRERMAEIQNELKNYVNAKVASFSHIAAVEEQTEEFAKTPSMKIKRFLYNRKSKH